MCDLSIALAVGGGLFQYMSQNEMAQAQMDAAAQSQKLMNAQIAEKQKQINQQSALEQSERNKQGMIERAQIATIAGESGALGFSSDRLMNDSFMQEGTDISSMELNRQNSIKQTEWEKQQAKVNTQNANSQAKASAGNILGTGLQIGTDIYRIHQSTKTQTKSKAGAA